MKSLERIIRQLSKRNNQQKLQGTKILSPLKSSSTQKGNRQIPNQNCRPRGNRCGRYYNGTRSTYHRKTIAIRCATSRPHMNDRFSDLARQRFGGAAGSQQPRRERGKGEAKTARDGDRRSTLETGMSLPI